MYFDDDMLYEYCEQEIKFSCRNMTHVIHDGLFLVKKAQKWSLKRSTIRNELRNKCKISNCLVLDTQQDLNFENPFFSFFAQKYAPKGIKKNFFHIFQKYYVIVSYSSPACRISVKSLQKQRNDTPSNIQGLDRFCAFSPVRIFRQLAGSLVVK